MSATSSPYAPPDFRAWFEIGPAAYLVLGAENFTIVAASEAYLRATMTRREAILGHGLFDVFPDNPADPSADGVHNLQASLLRAMATREPDTMPVQKYDIRRPDGSFEERYWSPVNTPVVDITGKVKWIIHRVEDVTGFVHSKSERVDEAPEGGDLRSRIEQMATEILLRGRELEEAKRRLEQVNAELVKREREAAQRTAELGRSNEDLAQFAYIASHDLQEPLRAVSSHAQLLARRYQEHLDDQGRKFLLHVVEGTTRMHRLIQHLLAYAKAGSGDMVLTATAVHSVLESALSDLKNQLEKTNAIVTHDELPTIWTDSVQLTQVFQNLIGNALKYRRPDVAPCIHISARHTRREWIFSVADNGQGFDTKDAEEIFGLFKRLHGRDIPGTGIGLALCRRIIERLGGRIWASAEPGHGTTVAFTLPDR